MQRVVIQQYYERAGFTSRGEIQSQGWKANLFEKKVTGEHA
jgi:hypothetical protein